MKALAGKILEALCVAAFTTVGAALGAKLLERVVPPEPQPEPVRKARRKRR